MFQYIKYLLIDGCVCNDVTEHSCDYVAIDYMGAWAMTSDHYAEVERVTMRMVTWTCGASLSVKWNNEYIVSGGGDSGRRQAKEDLVELIVYRVESDPHDARGSVRW